MKDKNKPVTIKVSVEVVAPVSNYDTRTVAKQSIEVVMPIEAAKGEIAEALRQVKSKVSEGLAAYQELIDADEE